jgi:hypothetical protein
MPPTTRKQTQKPATVTDTPARIGGRRRSDREPPTGLLVDVQRVSSSARSVVAERDRLIRAARAEGASWRELSDASGLSRSGVRRVCERSDPPDT